MAGEVRGTVENSESECSGGSICNEDKEEAEVFGLCSMAAETSSPSCSSLLYSSAASLFSLSSVSLRRKSTHRSANDWMEFHSNTKKVRLWLLSI